jgi:hypothetical protein
MKDTNRPRFGSASYYRFGSFGIWIKGMRLKKILQRTCIGVAVLMGCIGVLGFMLDATAPPKKLNPHAAPEKVAAYDAAKQSSPAVCESAQMDAQGVAHVSWKDAEQICNVMAASLGHQPSIRLLQTMDKMMFGFKLQGFNDSPKEIAYQVMNVIEERGQVNGDDESMIRTMNIIFKCFNGSQGHVTPKDFNINLRAMGSHAADVSDDFLYTMSALIQEDKKSRGQ